jgi:thiamine-monophosphate kinase
VNSLPGEFELIERYFRPLAKAFPGAYGLNDDAAIIAPLPDHELVAKTDAVVAGVHFLSDDPADLVARKALRVNLSDLAAKGAVPRAYMLDLMLPNTITEEWIAGFVSGLAQDQEHYGVHLIGGDTNATPGPLTVAVAAFGDIASGRMIRRATASRGDTVFVTGTIGDAALGLAVLHGDAPELDAGAANFLIDRYRLPQPRVALGQRLPGLASAGIDISDGLLADLGHVCAASNVSAVIEAARVPLSGAACAAIAADPRRIAAVLAGGDDYEILFTAPPSALSMLAEISRELGVPITEIGRVEGAAIGGKAKVTVLDNRGKPLAFDREGWTHF